MFHLTPATDAGPFTVHFWAPMSKWLISGASFFELDRPVEKISVSQYTALTFTGFFFSRCKFSICHVSLDFLFLTPIKFCVDALLVSPINPILCSVNIALFGSSFYHLARKVNADYLQIAIYKLQGKTAESEFKVLYRKDPGSHFGLSLWSTRLSIDSKTTIVETLRGCGRANMILLSSVNFSIQRE